MTAYATPADLIVRYDVRTLGDLCSDDGNRVPQALLATNTKLEALLSTASGQINAAVMRGDRYTAADLASLSGESQQYLVDLTCRIAFWLLWQRRPYSDDQNRMEAKKSADEALELLRTGAQVFEIDTVIEAGKPKVDTVSRTEITNNWNLVADRCRGRFFPVRRSYANQ